MLTAHRWMVLFAGIVVISVSGAAPVAAEDDSILPTWHLTEALTFTPALRIQTRYSYGPVPVEDGEPDPDHRFQLRRLRLKGKGDILGIAKYYSELKLDGSGFVDSPKAAVENAWVEFNHLLHTNPVKVGRTATP